MDFIFKYILLPYFEFFLFFFLFLFIFHHVKCREIIARDHAFLFRCSIMHMINYSFKEDVIIKNHNNIEINNKNLDLSIGFYKNVDSINSDDKEFIISLGSDYKSIIDIFSPDSQKLWGKCLCEKVEFDDFYKRSALFISHERISEKQYYVQKIQFEMFRKVEKCIPIVFLKIEIYFFGEGEIYIFAVGEPHKSGFNFLGRMMQYQKLMKYLTGEKFPLSEKRFFESRMKNYNFFLTRHK